MVVSLSGITQCAGQHFRLRALSALTSERILRQPTAGLARAADRVVRSPDRTAHFLEQGPKQTAHHAGRSRDLAGLVDEADLDAARSRARYLKAGPRHTEFDDDAPGIVDDAFTLAEFA